MPSMLTRVAAATGAVVIGSALMTAATVIPVRTPVEPPTQVRVGRHAVCAVAPPRQGDVTMLATAATDHVTIAPIGSGATQQVGKNSIVPIVKPQEPRLLTVQPGSNGAGSAMIARSDGLYMGLAASGCIDPGTRTWLVGIPSSTTRVSEVVMSNADEIPAEVDLNYYGMNGRIVVQSGHSAVVRPGETVVIPLEPIINEPGPIAVEVRSAQGRVAAMVRSRGLAPEGSASGTGVDWVSPSTTLRTQIIIPGVPGGPGARQLVLANPSETRALAKVQMLGRTGVTWPIGEGAAAVRAESTTIIDLDGEVPADGGALRIDSSEPITASLRVDNGAANADFATAPAAALVTREALMPIMLNPAHATVSLANPGTASSTVTLTARSAAGQVVGQPIVTQVAPQTAAQVNVPGTGATSVHVEVTEPVAAAMVLTQKTGAANGMAIVPLYPASSESRWSTPEHDTRVGG